jgi:hypothetical protein
MHFQPTEAGLIERFEQAADRTRRLHRLRMRLGEDNRADRRDRDAIDEQIRESEAVMRSIGRRLRRSA